MCQESRVDPDCADPNCAAGLPGRRSGPVPDVLSVPGGALDSPADDESDRVGVRRRAAADERGQAVPEDPQRGVADASGAAAAQPAVAAAEIRPPLPDGAAAGILVQEKGEGRVIRWNGRMPPERFTQDLTLPPPPPAGGTRSSRSPRLGLGDVPVPPDGLRRPQARRPPNRPRRSEPNPPKSDAPAGGWGPVWPPTRWAGLAQFERRNRSAEPPLPALTRRAASPSPG